MKHFILVSLLIGSSALAQNNRSAVSVNGNDANPCTTTAPCRSFTAALALTNPGGEVIAFDSGGYGSFTVTQSMSVIGAPGIHAAITVGTSHGIAIHAGATDSVLLRNLTVTETDSTMYDGIMADAFRLLTIE